MFSGQTKSVVLTLSLIVSQAQDGCFISYAGCRCLDEWSYNGISGLSGCANPDNDTVGSWCLVSDTEDCVAGKPLNTLPLADNAAFDYCQTQCMIVTEDDYAGRSLSDSFFSMLFGINNEDTLIVQSNTGRLPWNSGGTLSYSPQSPNQYEYIAYDTYDYGSAGCEVVYEVQSGDSLFEIGQSFGVSLQQVLDANPEISNPDLILVGQQIIIPTCSTPEPIPTPPLANTTSSQGFDFGDFFFGNTPPPTQTPFQPQTSASGSFVQDYSNSHNSRRRRHCVTEMSWDAGLAAQAQAYANGCIFEHSETEGYGENLFLGKGVYYTAEDVVGMWYDEISLYEYNNPGFFSTTGHFTQVVWRDSVVVGCGEQTECSIGQLVVCQYKPAGNVQGYFLDQVALPCA